MTATVPFFSVVIPVFNRAHLIATVVASVLHQEFPDFEVIVVDDGSTDNPEKALAGIADARLLVLRTANRGGGAARNTGIDAARGKYVAFLDSDDRYLPDHLSAIADAILSVADEVVVYGRVLVDRGNGILVQKPPRSIGAHEEMAAYLLCDRGWVPTPSLAVPRELARRVRFDETLRFGQDTDFAIRLALAGARFRMIERATVVVSDESSADRLSVTSSMDGVTAWLERLRPSISARAYYGYRGWHLAKAVAKKHYLEGVWMCLSAVARGCYAPRTACAAVLQVVLPARVYRRLGDLAIMSNLVAGWAGFRTTR